MLWISRMALATLAFALVAHEARGEDDTPAPPSATDVSSVTHEAWERARADIERSERTTVQKIEALRALASEGPIRVRGVVVDVRPHASREGWFVAEIENSLGGEPRHAFDVSPADHDAVITWKRGDRVTWRYVATVAATGAVTIRPVFAGLSDLRHVPTNGDDGSTSVLSWAEWRAAYRAARAPGATSAGAAAQLRDLVAGRLVEVRTKIMDVRQGPRDGWVTVETCGEFGGLPRQSFPIRPDEAERVLAWRRWDRITWRFTLTVNSLDDVRADLVFDSVDDLRHQRNPGITYPRPARPVKRVGAFESFLRGHAREVLADRWSSAWTRYARATQSIWTAPATVESVASDRVSVRIGGNLTASHRPSGMTWGVREKRTTVTVSDPQVLEALEPGAEIVLSMTLGGPTDEPELRRARGQFDVSFEFGALAE